MRQRTFDTAPTVLQIVTRMNVGGPASHVLVLAHGLGDRGYRVVLASGVCEESEGDAPLDVPASQPVIPIETLSRSFSPVRDLASIWRIYRLIRRHKPDIVHTHTAKAGMTGRVAACLAGVPVVVHTYHGNSLSGYFSPLASMCFRMTEKGLAFVTSRICVVSDQQLDEISGAFRVAPRRKFNVVPLGNDLSRELMLAPPVPGEVLNVGWLGRLVGIKDVRLLCAVVDEAFRRGLPVRFRIGGDGPERGAVQDCIARHGTERVQWSGWERDVPAFLSRCDLLIQTSRNEGTPVALIQGMAAARPFVSTSAGGVVDLVAGQGLVRECGTRWFANGVLAGPDPQAFASAITSLLLDPARLANMGLTARLFAATRFTADRLIEDIDRLYRELLEQHLGSKYHLAGARSGAEKLTGESQCMY